MVYIVCMQQLSRFKGRTDKMLQKQGVRLNSTQKSYLHCLVLEHIHNKRKTGELLIDIELEELRNGFISRLLMRFLPDVLEIKELE